MSDVGATIRESLARGDLIAAYDAASGAIAGGDQSSAIRHQLILALARMGDTERAMELFVAYGLDRSQNVDERTVGARLLKDRAFAVSAGQREEALQRAFNAYVSIYRESGDSFPGINAATLALLSGRRERGHELAGTLLTDPVVAAASGYFMAVTKAEALLILERTEEVAEILRGAAVSGCRDVGARSTSYRQLNMVAEHIGLGDAARAALLAPIAPPRVMHFSGHMFATDRAAEARLRAEVEAILGEEQIGFAYGSLACGSDIVVAEAALERGLKLHVVLPFEEEDFLAQSVLPGGDGWLARYRAARDSAASLTFASPMGFFGDPRQYSYGSRIAMGMARLRAEHLGGGAVQLALWDGVGSDGSAGTAVDVAVWREQGGRSRIVDPGPVERGLSRPTPSIVAGHERALAAILFSDFKGFSTLKESKLPAFTDGVMRVAAEVLNAHAGEVASRNSWGDAMFAVMTSAPAAAEIALELQDRLTKIDYDELGLESGSGGMRIGAHYGPAYRTNDHITGRITYYGTEVSKAARIEPVTPPGAVFVTEPFAAILALEARGRYTCRYVGRIALAKKYGDYPMYRLTRAAQ